MFIDDDDEDDDIQDHLDLAPIFKKLQKLKELSLSVRVNDVGMNFEWGFFTVSEKKTFQKCLL